MTDVENLVQDIRDNVPIKPLPSALLQPSLCIMDSVYWAQLHYSAVDDNNGGGVIGHCIEYRGIVTRRGDYLPATEFKDKLTDFINLIYA